MIPVVSTLVLCVASVGVGFYVGSRIQTVALQPELQAVNAKSSDDSDRDEDDSEFYDGNLDAVEGIGPCKLVLVVRTDLNMTTGKIAAQYVDTFYVIAFDLMSPVVLKVRVSDLFSHRPPVSIEPVYNRHATLACYKALLKRNPKVCAEHPYPKVIYQRDDACSL